MCGTFNLPRLAPYVINDLYHDDDMESDPKIVCRGAPSFVFVLSQLASAAPSLPTHFVLRLHSFISHWKSPLPERPEPPTSLPHSYSAMLFLFFVFGALISPTSSVATFNAAIFSLPARYALHDNHGRCIANSSSVSLTPP